MRLHCDDCLLIWSMICVVDVYSFGMTMWVISLGTGEEPFQSSSIPNASVAQKVQNGGLFAMLPDEVYPLTLILYVAT